jgi:hypothetical protein
MSSQRLLRMLTAASKAYQQRVKHEAQVSSQRLLRMLTAASKACQQRVKHEAQVSSQRLLRMVDCSRIGVKIQIGSRKLTFSHVVFPIFLFTFE